MKRDIYKKLLEWKKSTRRKPLLLMGARQVGKTYILKEFGKNEYEKVFYFNFEEDEIISRFFEKSISPDEIIKNLSIYVNQDILPEKHLIFFDEIQISNNALNSLKYFNEKANQYHIVSAGSLLGIKLSGKKSFPVGKVNFLRLNPMNFLEYLQALGEKKLVDLIKNNNEIKPYPEPIHEKLLQLLKYYYMVGGMPEVVKYFVENRDIKSIKEIQNEILTSYEIDFAKYANTSDIPKISLIWKSIPSQLSKDNKKFIFTAVKKSARAREYENAINWLEDNGLVIKIHRISKPNIPLKAYKKQNIFKLFLLDIGLLSALSNIDYRTVIYGNDIFTNYKGAFIENYVAQELKSSNFESYYWQSNGEAEIDFIIEKENIVFPIEVKAGINTKSKSLKFFNEKFSPEILLRANLLNLKKDGKIINIPLYAISSLENFILNK